MTLRGVLMMGRIRRSAKDRKRVLVQIAPLAKMRFYWLRVIWPGRTSIALDERKLGFSAVPSSVDIITPKTAPTFIGRYVADAV